MNSNIDFIPPAARSSVEKRAPVLKLTLPRRADFPKSICPDDPSIEKLYAIKTAAECMWEIEDLPFEWDDADTRAAKAVVAELHTWSADDFKVAVVSRFRSININISEPIRHWLRKLEKYRMGPLDNYEHDKYLSLQERQNWREQVLAMLAGRKPVGEQIVLPIDSTERDHTA